MTLADQFDAALTVAYRSDDATYRVLMDLRPAIDAAVGELEELRAADRTVPLWRSDGEREAYARFGEAVRKVVVECYRDERIDEWANDLTELLAKFGLARRVKYDPEQHGYVDCADPGAEIWWLGEGEAERAPERNAAQTANDQDQAPQGSGA